MKGTISPGDCGGNAYIHHSTEQHEVSLRKEMYGIRNCPAEIAYTVLSPKALHAGIVYLFI